MRTFCIIPSYNEDLKIQKTVMEVRDFVDRVIVVDDGSSTAFDWNIFQNDEKIMVLRHVVNRGQGAALRTGTEYALKSGADIIVHFDADGQFLAYEIPAIIAPLLSGEADIVFGSRFLNIRSRIPLFKKSVIMPLARLANRWILNIKELTDPQSGFRAYTSEAARKINIEQDRMAHCSEILHKAFKTKLKIKEVGISVIYEDFGQRFSGGLKIIKEMILGRMT